MEDRDRTARTATVEIWAFAQPALRASDLIGFDVEARDGGIGKVDDATDEAGRAHLVVDTGAWIFGRKVMLPAGTVDRVDLDSETVFVARTKDEIENAPEYDEGARNDDRYRERLGGYYGGS